MTRDTTIVSIIGVVCISPECYTVRDTIREIDDTE